MLLFAVLGCAQETTGLPGSGDPYTFTSCQDISDNVECTNVRECCVGDQNGTDSCLIRSSLGSWDCASPEDCAAATDEAVLTTCPPPHTGDTGLDTGTPG